MKCHINSLKHLSIDVNNIIKLNYEALLFRVIGIAYCKITNFDCTALSNDIYNEVSTSFESLSLNESNSEESDRKL
jgi:hypothetical protein